MIKPRTIKIWLKRLIRRPVLGVVIFVLLCTVIAETLARGSVTSAALWACTRPHRLLALGVFLLVIFKSLQTLTGSFRLSWAIGFPPIMLLSMVHAAKFAARNEPLYPWDVMLFKQGKSITTMDFFPLSILQTIIVLIILAFMGWLAWSMPKRKQSLRKLAYGPIAFTIIIVSVFAARNMDSWRELCIYSGFHFWDQNKTTKRLGFIPSFVMNLPSAAVTPPKGYSHQAAEEIYSRFPAPIDAPSPKKQPVNLILLVSEGFWDPAGLKKIQFENDPVKNFRTISENHGSITLISPVLGGNTCNAEFELLTGLNMSFLPAGSIPFQQYIRTPMGSLASQLAENGYESIAIHPFHKWFWNRDKVYPLLGFDKFISMENMTHRQISGEYISDMSLTKEIIDAAQSSDKPFFIYAVSMENHCPYPIKRYQNEYNDPGLEQAGSFLTSKQQDILKTYITGLHHADLALGALIEHFSKSDKPTMIVFLGDHLAYLDAGYGIYKKCGYLDSNKLFPKMFTQKAGIWTNYDIESSKTESPISFSYLPGILLDALEIPPSPMQQYHAKIRQTHRVIRHREIPDGLDSYKILQYDALFRPQANSK